MKRVSLVFLALSMTTAIAVAHGGPGGPGRDDGHYGGGTEVGSDGTLYLSSVSVDSSAGTASTKITAVRPSGTVAWTVTLAVGAEVELSGGNVIAESYTRSDGTITTTLTAISAASGATAWTKTINGRVELIPFSGGTYAIVTVPATTSGGTATRSVIGIGNDGSTLFTLAL